MSNPILGNSEQRNNWFMSFIEPKGGQAWNLLAGAALIGAGYLAAHFTMGEEEYAEHSPNQIPLQRSESTGSVAYGGEQLYQREREVYVDVDNGDDWGSNGKSNSSYPPGDDYANNEYRGGATSARNSYFENAKPAWVDDLLAKLEQVDGKLEEIKQAVVRQDALNKEDSKISVTETLNDKRNAKITDYLDKVEKVPELADFEMDVKEKVKALKYDEKESEGGPSGSLEGSIGAILMYITKIVEQPSVPRYRRISVSNQTYKAHLSPLKGHEDFLKALGFTKKGSCFEWTDTSSLTASGTSNDTAPRLDLEKLSAEQRLDLLKGSVELLKARISSDGSSSSSIE